MTSFSPKRQSRSPEAAAVAWARSTCWSSRRGAGSLAGELEVAARIAIRALSTTHRLYLMTRHFIWLVPLINLVLFLGFGVLLALATRRWPARAGWWSPAADRHLGRPAGAGGGRPGIYAEAWFLVALGVAFRMVPVLERHPAAAAARGWCGASRSCWGWSCSRRAGSSGGDRIKQWREEGRPLPPAGSPNVLLIVLDTVRADHLSVYGYRSRHHAHPGAAGGAGNPLRRGPRTRPLDARLARQLLHRPLAP